MGLLEGKVALITGGARGQGRAHAVLSAQEGADVIVTDIAAPVETTVYETATPADLDETVRLVEAEGRRALGIVADVRSQEQMDDAVSQGINAFDQIDILVANAGIWNLARFWEMSDEFWQETIDINLTGVWRSVKAVTPHMIGRQSGSIVLTSSLNGLEGGAGYAHYTAAKHGVVGLMRSMALELGPFGIRVNTVHPGAIDTEMNNYQEALDLFAGRPGGTEEDKIAAGRHVGVLKGTTFLPPVEVAKAALWLNSDLASSVTGITVPVDAGHMAIPGFNHAPVT